MLDIKYVMVDDVLPILFNGRNHRDLGLQGKITSAGFIEISIKNGELDVVAYGKSQTLGIGFKDTDAAMIKNFLMRGRDRC